MPPMDDPTALEKFLCDHQLMEKLFDHVTLIDPERMSVVSILKASPNVPSDHCQGAACYRFWNKNSACVNCVAARSLHQDKPFVKIEFRDERVFMVFSAPIKHDGKRCAVELYKDITESGVLDFEGKNASEIHRIINRRNMHIVQDALTRLHNEEFIHSQLPYSIMQAAESSQHLALLYIKIENINEINLQYGYSAGDLVLRDCARALRLYCRSEEDWTARHGDTGFILVMPGCDESEAYQIGKRISDKFKKPVTHHGPHIMTASISIGINVLEKNPVSAEEMIRLASEKLVFPSQSGMASGSGTDEQAVMRFFRSFLLTAREDEIALMLLEGLSNAEIAKTLFVSVPTVKKHVSAILDKAGVSSRAEFSAKFRDSLHG